jgi:hypothetical protein
VFFFFLFFLLHTVQNTISWVKYSFSEEVLSLKSCSKCVNPFVTSGTCMSHLQIALSSLLGYHYPTSSPCCHLPWTIPTPWNQSECIFLRNNRLQMLLCAMLRGWLSVVMYFSQFWVYFSEISVIGAFIFSVLLFTMHLYVSCLVFGNWERYDQKRIFVFM